MIPIKFNKERAEEVIACIAQGEPIAPQGDHGWTVNDMLLTAGALFFGAMSHGPKVLWKENIPDNQEHQEAQQGQFYNDLHAAVEFYGELVMQVRDHEYDNNFESEVLALVTQTGETKKHLKPIQGVKGHD